MIAFSLSIMYDVYLSTETAIRRCRSIILLTIAATLLIITIAIASNGSSHVAMFTNCGEKKVQGAKQSIHSSKHSSFYVACTSNRTSML